MNGPALTTIKGRWDPDTINGPAAVRCVYMVNYSALIGFTLTNGATLQLDYPAPGNDENHVGGGIWCYARWNIYTPWPTNMAVISNCVIAGNSAAYKGGGTYRGNLYNCTLSGNVSHEHTGGGASGSAYVPARLFNCTIVGNYSPTVGAGTSQCRLYNCLLIGNKGSSASYSEVLYNCTLVGNSSRGMYYSKMYNCISWGNKNEDQGTTPPRFSCGVGALYTNSLLGNTTNNPRFITDGTGYGASHVAGNYRLQAYSPCVNTGTNGSWTTNTVDLDGRTRIRYGVVDMGAYERINGGTIFGVH